MEAPQRAVLYAGAAVLAWSTVATAFKLALRDLDHVQLLFVSTVSSAVALLAIVAGQGKLGVLVRQDRRDWARSLGLGILNPLSFIFDNKNDSQLLTICQ